MYVKQTSPLAMSAEHTRSRHASLSALRHGRHHLMRQVGLRSRCVQCGLPRCAQCGLPRCAQCGLLRCSPLHLLPLRAPSECQIPAHGSPQAPPRPQPEHLRGLVDCRCVVVVPQVGEALRPDSLPTASDSQLKCPLRHRPLTDGAPPSSSSVSSSSGCSIHRHCNSPGASQTRCFLPPKGSGQMFTTLESACRPENTGSG